jgi:hypothetical protein
MCYNYIPPRIHRMLEKINGLLHASYIVSTGPEISDVIYQPVAFGHTKKTGGSPPPV